MVVIQMGGGNGINKLLTIFYHNKLNINVIIAIQYPNV
jgi:hypothetical protein